MEHSTPAMNAAVVLTRLNRLLGLTVLSLLLLVVTGCQTSGPRHKADLRFKDAFTVETEQLRLKMRSLVDPLCGIVEQAADTILAQTSDQSIRRAALVWKIEAVPSLREALYQPNPYTALADSWSLSYQMIDYFESGRGKTALGSAAGIALTASQRLEHELAGTAGSAMNPQAASRMQLAVQEWAAEHPIRDSVAERDTTLGRAVERGDSGALSVPQVAGALNVTVDDLNRRMEVYSYQLLQQSRWQAELFAMDVATQYQVDQVMPMLEGALGSLDRAVVAVERLVPSAERSVAVVESAPDLIAQERATTLAAIHAEVAETLKFLDQERLTVLESLSQERAALVKDLQQAMAEERKILLAEGDRMSLKVVDHAFYRAAQLVAAVMVALLIAFVATLVFVNRLVRQRTPGNGSSPRNKGGTD